jgi:hypothetical protein
MHHLGIVNLLGFIAYHRPSEKRAKLLRTILHLQGLPDMPVAAGTDGTSGREKRDLFWHELRNQTFEHQDWNKDEEQLCGYNLIDINGRWQLILTVFASPRHIYLWVVTGKGESDSYKRESSKCLPRFPNLQAALDALNQPKKYRHQKHHGRDPEGVPLNPVPPVTPPLR